MTQRTIVALYGEKAPELARFITECQRIIGTVAGTAFTPLDLRQVHATIVGLEAADESSPQVNANFARYRGVHARMDVEGFVAHIRAREEIPFRVQFGGFGAGVRPFTSRGQPPHERSFSIQGEKAVVIGWPTDRDGRYSAVVNALRRDAQKFGILHAYHRQPEDVDNDFFMRIGRLDGANLSADVIGSLEARLRAFIGSRDPLLVEIALHDLALVEYEDNTLPLHSSAAHPLQDA